MAVSRNNIKNIIFDLGGVILELATNDTLVAFGRLSGLDVATIKQIFVSSSEFEDYEKGVMTDEAFRDFIRVRYNVSSSDDEIDHCWNKMLKALPIENLRLLRQLKSKYRTFLLSNTNGIHLNYINDVLLYNETGELSLDSYFHHAYYSHRMFKRKPQQGIFQRVLEDNALIASETLFLDDNTANIDAAKSLGIQTVLITSHNQIQELFND